MLLLDLKAAGSVAVEVALRHLPSPLRATDETELVAACVSGEEMARQSVARSRFAWAILSPDYRLLGLVGFMPWEVSSDVPEGLLWAIGSASLEHPSPDLTAALASALRQVAAEHPKMWAHKLPTDTAADLPRWKAEKTRDQRTASDLVMVGPEPALDSPAWLTWFAAETGLTSQSFEGVPHG